jgi:molybdopterin molybdotransferase
MTLTPLFPSMDRPAQPPADVRMRGFAHRSTVEQALAWVDSAAQPLPSEQISLWQAAGRILTADIASPVDVPAFPRSMMDGYALRAAETQGASPYNRLEFIIVGQSLAGQPFPQTVHPQQAIRIMTGAPLPAGCDSVLPAEVAEAIDDRLYALNEVSPGKNVGQRGEDIQRGTTVLPAGRTLRPQDLGILSSIGHSTVDVVRQPRVRIVITGNELLPAGQPATGSQLPDSNGPMLAALVTRDGGLPFLNNLEPETWDLKPPLSYLVPDDRASILSALQSDADIILVSGGTSVGQEDHAPSLLAEHGELAIHGIAMRPSSPTGMGRLDHRLVFLLPGNPVSCLCAYDFFAGRAIRLLAGRSPDWPYRKICLPLARKLVSQVGRLDYARIRIIENPASLPPNLKPETWNLKLPSSPLTPHPSSLFVDPIAISGASILSSTTTAHGFVLIPANSEGFASGTSVDVYLYDP